MNVLKILSLNFKKILEVEDKNKDEEAEVENATLLVILPVC